MEISIGKLSEGKSTIIKDKEYFETKEYTNPFISVMGRFTNEFIIKVQLPNQFTITDAKEDITFNRVWIQAIMPAADDIDGLAETYNLVYALDVQHPVYKIFKAYKDRRNDNLFVFNSNWLRVFELKPNTKFIDFSETIKQLMESPNDVEIKLKKMKTTFLSNDAEELQRKLGSIIENTLFEEYKHKGGKIKLSTQMAIKAYQNVYLDPESKYYTPDTEQSNIYNFYESFASLVTADKDIVNTFEKSALALIILESELWK